MTGRRLVSPRECRRYVEVPRVLAHVSELIGRPSTLFAALAAPPVFLIGVMNTLPRSVSAPREIYRCQSFPLLVLAEEKAAGAKDRQLILRTSPSHELNREILPFFKRWIADSGSSR